VPSALLESFHRAARWVPTTSGGLFANGCSESSDRVLRAIFGYGNARLHTEPRLIFSPDRPRSLSFAPSFSAPHENRADEWRAILRVRVVFPPAVPRRLTVRR